MVDPESLKRQHPELARFDVRATDEDVIFTYAGSEVATIEGRNGGCILESSHGHAHCDEAEEAALLLVAFLQGEFRWVQEFRGDALAACWLESREGDSWANHEGSIFLCPFDADEWTPRNGELWKVRRIAWKLTPESSFEEETSEVENSEPTLKPESWIRILDRTLGPPAEGMKWTLGRDNRLVLQIPASWRRMPSESPDQTFVNFASSERALLVRVQNFYRPTQTPVPERESTIRPTLREYEREEASPENKGWACDKWTLTFMGDADDMLVLVELFEHESKPGAAETLRRKFEETVGEARYVPMNWRMQPES